MPCSALTFLHLTSSCLHLLARPCLRLTSPSLARPCLRLTSPSLVQSRPHINFSFPPPRLHCASASSSSTSPHLASTSLLDLASAWPRPASPPPRILFSLIPRLLPRLRVASFIFCLALPPRVAASRCRLGSITSDCRVLRFLKNEEYRKISRKIFETRLAPYKIYIN